MGLIYLDACLLIYLIERHPDWADRVAATIADAGTSRFAISPLVELECLVAPLRRGDPVLRDAYQSFFRLLEPLAMPAEVYRQAAAVRAQFGLRTPDALHLSCARHHQCEALWTNDDRLARASLGMARNILA